MSFLHYFHAAISNHPSEMPKKLSCLNDGLTGLTVVETFQVENGQPIDQWLSRLLIELLKCAISSQPRAVEQRD